MKLSLKPRRTVNRDRTLDMWRDKNRSFESFSNSGSTNLAAWEASRKGAEIIRGYTVTSMSNALRHFERAVELDPNYARGWSTIAIALTLFVNYGYLPSTNALPRAQACVEKALQIEPHFGFGYSTLAEIALARDYDFPAAERLYRKALKLVPAGSSADLNFARLLTYYGRFEEAQQLLQALTSENPAASGALLFTARLYSAMGRYEEALSVFEEAEPFNPRPMLYFDRADLHGGMGHFADANGSPPDKDRTATIERVADPAAMNLDALFEIEWRRNLLEAALETIKKKFSLKQIQIFDLHAQKEWPARDVAKSLGVSLANVYVTKHRVSTALRKEMERMERVMRLGEQ